MAVLRLRSCFHLASLRNAHYPALIALSHISSRSCHDGCAIRIPNYCACPTLTATGLAFLSSGQIFWCLGRVRGLERMERTALSANVLNNRDFRKLWAGQGASLFGSLVSRLVLPFFVIYTLSATPMEVAWVRVAEVVPGLVVGLLAGVVADRWRRRRIMIMTDSLRAILVGLIPLLFLLHRLTLGLVIGLVVLLSMSQIVFDSAYDAYLPTLVPVQQLVDANAKMSALSAVAEVTGFGIAGVLFQWLGGALAFSVDMLSFVVSALTLWAIRRSEPAPAAPDNEHLLVSDLFQGLSSLCKHSLLRRVALIDSGNSLYFGLSSAVYMLYISRGLHLAPAWQGILYAVGGVASFISAGLTTRVISKLGHARALTTGTVVAAAGTAFLPLAFGPIWLLIFFVLGQQVVGDAGDTLVAVGLSSLRQQHTDNAALGRVRSAWLVVTSLGTLCGILLGGQLAEHVGLRATLFVGVGVRLVVAILTIRSTPLIARMANFTSYDSSQ